MIMEYTESIVQNSQTHFVINQDSLIPYRNKQNNLINILRFFQGEIGPRGTAGRAGTPVSNSSTIKKINSILKEFLGFSGRNGSSRTIGS